MKKKYEKNSDVKVLFLGTPEIAVRPLLGLIQAGFDVVGVVCQEDKIVGRSQKIELSPIKKIALKAGIPVFQPHRIRKDFSFAKDLSFDVIVCMAYGQIVPDEFLSLAPKKAINLHGSLLPSLRGAAPIQRAIMNGEKETGITLMEMVSELDAGRMYDKKAVKIEEDDTYTTLSRKLSELAEEIIVNDLLPYVNDELLGTPQDQNKATYADKILPADEHLPLDLSASEAECYIRALADTPGAYITLRGKKLKLYGAKACEDIEVPFGVLKPTKHALLLGLKKGVLALKEIQFEGKKRMDALSFMNGAHLLPNGENVE